MSSAWLLPEHIADVLPAQARRVEELRRSLLDLARSYGFELVMPPLLEHLESLLSGTGRELDLKTFKLADQLSGRTLGLRADTTPQVARIDAHLLNRQGVARLCYCGPVLHTRPSGLHGTREPLQFGAEIYGHAGLEADLEVQDLALDGLRLLGLRELTIDLGDARIVEALLEGADWDAARVADLIAALSAKDASAVQSCTRALPQESRAALCALPELYGGVETLQAARRCLPERTALRAALDDLDWLAGHLKQVHPEIGIGVDLSDVGGYAYYSGVRWAVYGAGSPDSLVRGGRYDEVGAVFGRKRPAVGCSLDLKALASMTEPASPRPAIRAPWGEQAALRSAVRELRSRGETVVCSLPGHSHEAEEFACDRELIEKGGRWVLQPL